MRLRDCSRNPMVVHPYYFFCFFVQLPITSEISSRHRSTPSLARTVSSSSSVNDYINNADNNDYNENDRDDNKNNCGNDKKLRQRASEQLLRLQA